MKSNIRRNVPGAFLVRDLGHGAWRLSTTVPSNLEVFVQGAGPDAMQALALPNCNGLSLEWQEAGVLLTLSSPAGVRSANVRSAIIHEPRTHLYEALPLVSFDGDARRFWRRIFRLVRVPGGRYLLRFLARRKPPQA
jgi:hypothetical protein